MRKALISLLVALCLVVTVSAHSGRTDSNGGHKDNKNVSGLGSYHYHCGGYPAHLHTGGYCPYRDIFPTAVTVSAEKTKLIVGEKTTLTGNVSPSDACSKNVKWESSNTKVVSVKNGVATAVGTGTATITGTTFNGETDQITIEVEEKPTEAPTDKPTDLPTEIPTEISKDKPSEDPTDSTGGITALPENNPTETDADADTEEPEGSALLGFIVIAGIVGIVVLFKRKR